MFRGFGSCLIFYCKMFYAYQYVKNGWICDLAFVMIETCQQDVYL